MKMQLKQHESGNTLKPTVRGKEERGFANSGPLITFAMSTYLLSLSLEWSLSICQDCHDKVLHPGQFSSTEKLSHRPRGQKSQRINSLSLGRAQGSVIWTSLLGLQVTSRCSHDILLMHMSVPQTLPLNTSTNNMMLGPYSSMTASNCIGNDGF